MHTWWPVTQGEESRVVLLSLVRSNDQGQAGFTAMENRAVVALSRAKEGFVIVGNGALNACSVPEPLRLPASLH